MNKVSYKKIKLAFSLILCKGTTLFSFVQGEKEKNCVFLKKNVVLFVHYIYIPYLCREFD